MLCGSADVDLVDQAGVVGHGDCTAVSFNVDQRDALEFFENGSGGAAALLTVEEWKLEHQLGVPGTSRLLGHLSASAGRGLGCASPAGLAAVVTLTALMEWPAVVICGAVMRRLSASAVGPALGHGWADVGRRGQLAAWLVNSFGGVGRPEPDQSTLDQRTEQ